MSSVKDYTDKDVYAFLVDRFQPIYADLVASLAKKPTQIVFQLEAAFVHIATANKYPDRYQVNINKAYSHLQRATLDTAKILWHFHKRQLEGFVDDESLRKYCVNCSEPEFLKRYQQTESLARKARLLEIQSVGIDPEISVAAYYDAAIKLRAVLEFVDLDKARSFNRFRTLRRYTDYMIGFVLGVIASIVAAVITDALKFW